MIRRVINLLLDALFCFAFLSLAIAVQGRGAEPAVTNASPPPVFAPGTPILTNAEQVHGLSREQAGGRQRVLIRGVVTCSLPDLKGAVVQDPTCGIYFDLWK